MYPIEQVEALNPEVTRMVVRAPDVFDFNAFIPGIVAVVIGFVLLGVFYWIRERQRYAHGASAETKECFCKEARSLSLIAGIRSCARTRARSCDANTPPLW